VLAVAALSQTGCQSGFLGPCSSCGDRFRNLSERVFRPFRGNAGPCCGSDLGVAASPLPYATPSVVTPAPAPAPSGVLTPAPDSVSTPQLEPIPSASPGPPASGGDSTPSQGAKASPGKANYEALRPKYRESLSQSRGTRPEPTIRSAQGSPVSQADEEPNPLDNLPPLDLPREVTHADTPPPVAAPGPAPAAETLADLAAKSVSHSGSDVTVAPGIRRIAGVESKLSGGSMPNASGLDWLAEKGYKTVLDLREESEISAAFISDVARRGMRYIALPITVKTVDADHVSRFLFELTLADARPLYFFDTDGTRAGVMWYVRRVVVDKVDRQVARRDAEELGLSDDKFWLAANAYLDSIAPTPAPADKPAPAPAAPAPTPAPPVDDASKPAPAPAPAPATGANAPPAPSAGPPPGPSADAGPQPVSHDPTAWKPLAALVVTGLGVPLAYVSRVAIPPSLVSLAKASLPGPRRSPKSLPGRSDG